VRRVICRHDGAEHAPRALAARAAELVPAGRAAPFNQAMMELGATVCRPRRPVCEVCPVRRGCASEGREAEPRPRPAARRERFKDSDRWARGRIVAALVAGEAPPPLAPARRERAEAGLLRDGLAVRGVDGSLRLP
ncbi:MAG TPA: A/G-specific adenine glycosylase, partial [Solirubrobacteraceae bacterium]|nr:A/G-specific adenine glycosylase [Solirubrobacteraceae bacterium]